MQRLVPTVLCIFSVACGEKVVDLGAGYKYVRLDGPNAAISDHDNHMVVDPNVTRYKVIGSYIVGERADANIDKRLSRNFGYFIVDTRTGQLVEGLDRPAFENALHARGLNVPRF